MTDNKPAPEDAALWQRRLASQANNRAWTLAEMLSRSPEQDEAMLHAAHAAMHFWSIVGDPGHRANAEQLLAHVYALLKWPERAALYLGKSSAYFEQRIGEPWEVAFGHAVAANVAYAAGNLTDHARHYAKAVAAAADITDPPTLDMFAATLRVIPAPDR